MPDGLYTRLHEQIFFLNTYRDAQFVNINIRRLRKHDIILLHYLTKLMLSYA